MNSTRLLVTLSSGLASSILCMNGAIQWISLGGLTLLLVIAVVTDLRARRIANWLCGLVALLALPWWWASGVPLWSTLGVQCALATGTFVVFAFAFARGWMGGGDVKLLTALALWIAPLWFMRLVIVMSIIGGLLTLVMWIHHRARQRTERLAIPYGVAIASAGLWALFAQHRALFHLPANAAGLG